MGQVVSKLTQIDITHVFPGELLIVGGTKLPSQISLKDGKANPGNFARNDLRF